MKDNILLVGHGNRDRMIPFMELEFHNTDANIFVMDMEGELCHGYRNKLENRGYRVEEFVLSGENKEGFNPFLFLEKNDNDSLECFARAFLNKEHLYWCDRRDDPSFMSSLKLLFKKAVGKLIKEYPEDTWNFVTVCDILDGFHENSSDNPEDRKKLEVLMEMATAFRVRLCNKKTNPWYFTGLPFSAKTAVFLRISGSDITYYPMVNIILSFLVRNQTKAVNEGKPGVKELFLFLDYLQFFGLLFRYEDLSPLTAQCGIHNYIHIRSFEELCIIAKKEQEDCRKFISCFDKVFQFRESCHYLDNKLCKLLGLKEKTVF